MRVLGYLESKIAGMRIRDYLFEPPHYTDEKKLRLRVHYLGPMLSMRCNAYLKLIKCLTVAL